MVYKYGEWHLYMIEPNFKIIGKRKMYFFSKKIPNRGTQCDLPDGYKIGINKRTELPYLMYKNKISLHQKKKKEREQKDLLKKSGNCFLK
jgi:hypothetical protein